MTDLPNVSFVGRSVSRREDQRLLTGRGQFIADLKLPQMLHAVVVRSPVAHARIKAIDLSRAAAMPGIIYALSGSELARQLPPVPDTQLALPSKLDVGGGFGVKGHVYPEDLLIPFLARKLGRPVQWIEDRHEHLLCSCQSRDQTHDVEIGFDDDGRILGLRDHFIVDCGAWNPIGAGVVYNTAVHLPGPYKIAALAFDAKIAATNKVPNAPYRGAGRPEAAFAMERVIELIAGELGREAAEVRLRNMVGADEMPYHMGLPYRDGQPIVYDGGDYPAALEKALDAIGSLPAFRERQRAAWQDGRYLGLRIGCYVEGTGVGPFESATVRIDPSGKIFVASGACPQGQGMETNFRAGRRRHLARCPRRCCHCAC